MPCKQNFIYHLFDLTLNACKKIIHSNEKDKNKNSIYLPNWNLGVLHDDRHRELEWGHDSPELLELFIEILTRQQFRCEQCERSLTALVHFPVTPLESVYSTFESVIMADFR